MVVLLVVGGLHKMERHCLCTVVIGRGEVGRENKGVPVQTAHMLGGGATGVCSSGGKLVVYPVCKKRRELQSQLDTHGEQSPLRHFRSISSYSFHTANTKNTHIN